MEYCLLALSGVMCCLQFILSIVVALNTTIMLALHQEGSTLAVGELAGVSAVCCMFLCDHVLLVVQCSAMAVHAQVCWHG